MKASSNPYQAYQDNQVSTADQKQLIVMLYEGAIKFLKIAIENMDFKTYDVVNENIIKAQDIITELMLSLDMDKGGEIATNLMSIYSYWKKDLLEANVAKETPKIESVISLMQNLKDGWAQIDMSKVKPEAVIPQTTQQLGGFVAQG